MQEQGDLEAAINAFNKALDHQANHPDALNNLEVALQEQGDLDAAINTFNAAINIKPDHFGARINLSMAVLLLGDFKNGWRNYDYRLEGHYDQNILYANPPCDQWNHINGRVKTQLLLVSEQRLGDTLLFMRYLKVLKEHGINVSLYDQTSLHSLIQTSGIDPAPLTPDQANRVDQGQWSHSSQFPVIYPSAQIIPSSLSPTSKQRRNSSANGKPSSRQSNDPSSASTGREILTTKQPTQKADHCL